jgi:hypothetical protein
MIIFYGLEKILNGLYFFLQSNIVA